MSKAILKFDLSDPDDYMEFKRASKASDITFSLFEITRNLKKRLEWEIAAEMSKAQDKGEEFGAFDALDLVYDAIFAELDNNHINIDELT